MKIKLSNVFVVVGLFIYKSLLDFVYLRYISDLWNYAGFFDNHNGDNYLISIFIFLISLPFILPIIQDKNERGSSIIVTGLYFIAFLPFTTCVYVGLFPQVEYVFLGCIYWFMLLGCEWYSLRKNKLQYIGMRLTKRNSRRMIMAISIFLVAVVVYVSWRYTGFRLNFDLSRVYELRMEARTWGGGLILGYALAWAGTCIPFLIGYFCEEKKYLWVIGLFVIAMLNFGIEGHKKIFFLPIFILVIMVLCKWMNVLIFKKVMLVGLIFLNFLGIAEMELVGTFNLISLFIRRVMFVPSWLSWCYYDFFQNHPFDYFQSSFLRHFGFVSPYSDLALPFRIGFDYCGNIQTNCNNGLIADALTNFGYAGVIVMPIVLIMLFRFMDCITDGVSECIKIFTFFIFTHCFVDTFLFTVLGTHGLLVALLLLIILQDQYTSKQSEMIGRI